MAVPLGLIATAALFAAVQIFPYAPVPVAVVHNAIIVANLLPYYAPDFNAAQQLIQNLKASPSSSGPASQSVVPAHKTLNEIVGEAVTEAVQKAPEFTQTIVYDEESQVYSVPIADGYTTVPVAGYTTPTEPSLDATLFSISTAPAVDESFNAPADLTLDDIVPDTAQVTKYPSTIATEQSPDASSSSAVDHTFSDDAENMTTADRSHTVIPEQSPDASTSTTVPPDVRPLDNPTGSTQEHSSRHSFVHKVAAVSNVRKFITILTDRVRAGSADLKTTTHFTSDAQGATTSSKDSSTPSESPEDLVETVSISTDTPLAVDETSEPPTDSTIDTAHDQSITRTTTMSSNVRKFITSVTEKILSASAIVSTTPLSSGASDNPSSRTTPEATSHTIGSKTSAANFMHRKASTIEEHEQLHERYDLHPNPEQNEVVPRWYPFTFWHFAVANLVAILYCFVTMPGPPALQGLPWHGNYQFANIILALRTRWDALHGLTLPEYFRCHVLVLFHAIAVDFVCRAIVFPTLIVVGALLVVVGIWLRMVLSNIWASIVHSASEVFNATCSLARESWTYLYNFFKEHTFLITGVTTYIRESWTCLCYYASRINFSPVWMSQATEHVLAFFWYYIRNAIIMGFALARVVFHAFELLVYRAFVIIAKGISISYFAMRSLDPSGLFDWVQHYFWSAIDFVQSMANSPFVGMGSILIWLKSSAATAFSASTSLSGSLLEGSFGSVVQTCSDNWCPITLRWLWRGPFLIIVTAYPVLEIIQAWSTWPQTAVRLIFLVVTSAAVWWGLTCVPSIGGVECTQDVIIIGITVLYLLYLYLRPFGQTVGANAAAQDADAPDSPTKQVPVEPESRVGPAGAGHGQTLADSCRELVEIWRQVLQQFVILVCTIARLAWVHSLRYMRSLPAKLREAPVVDVPKRAAISELTDELDLHHASIETSNIAVVDNRTQVQQAPDDTENVVKIREQAIAAMFDAGDKAADKPELQQQSESLTQKAVVEIVKQSGPQADTVKDAPVVEPQEVDTPTSQADVIDQPTSSSKAVEPSTNYQKGRKQVAPIVTANLPRPNLPLIIPTGTLTPASPSPLAVHDSNLGAVQARLDERETERKREEAERLRNAAAEKERNLIAEQDAKIEESKASQVEPTVSEAAAMKEGNHALAQKIRDTQAAADGAGDPHDSDDDDNDKKAGKKADEPHLPSPKKAGKPADLAPKKAEDAAKPKKVDVIKKPVHHKSSSPKSSDEVPKPKEAAVGDSAQPTAPVTKTPQAAPQPVVTASMKPHHVIKPKEVIDEESVEPGSPIDLARFPLPPLYQAPRTRPPIGPNTLQAFTDRMLGGPSVLTVMRREREREAALAADSNNDGGSGRGAETASKAEHEEKPGSKGDAPQQPPSGPQSGPADGDDFKDDGDDNDDSDKPDSGGAAVASSNATNQTALLKAPISNTSPINNIEDVDTPMQNVGAEATAVVESIDTDMSDAPMQDDSSAIAVPAPEVPTPMPASAPNSSIKLSPSGAQQYRDNPGNQEDDRDSIDNDSLFNDFEQDFEDVPGCQVQVNNARPKRSGSPSRPDYARQQQYTTNTFEAKNRNYNDPEEMKRLRAILDSIPPVTAPEPPRDDTPLTHMEDANFSPVQSVHGDNNGDVDMGEAENEGNNATASTANPLAAPTHLTEGPIQDVKMDDAAPPAPSAIPTPAPVFPQNNGFGGFRTYIPAGGSIFQKSTAPLAPTSTSHTNFGTPGSSIFPHGPSTAFQFGSGASHPNIFAPHSPAPVAYNGPSVLSQGQGGLQNTDTAPTTIDQATLTPAVEAFPKTPVTAVPVTTNAATDTAAPDATNGDASSDISSDISSLPGEEKNNPEDEHLAFNDADKSDHNAAKNKEAKAAHEQIFKSNEFVTESDDDSVLSDENEDDTAEIAKKDKLRQKSTTSEIDKQMQEVRVLMQQRKAQEVTYIRPDDKTKHEDDGIEGKTMDDLKADPDTLAKRFIKAPKPRRTAGSAPSTPMLNNLFRYESIAPKHSTPEPNPECSPVPKYASAKKDKEAAKDIAKTNSLRQQETPKSKADKQSKKSEIITGETMDSLRATPKVLANRNIKAPRTQRPRDSVSSTPTTPSNTTQFTFGTGNLVSDSEREEAFKASNKKALDVLNLIPVRTAATRPPTPREAAAMKPSYNPTASFYPTAGPRKDPPPTTTSNVINPSTNQNVIMPRQEGPPPSTNQLRPSYGPNNPPLKLKSFYERDYMWDKEGNRYMIRGLGDERHIIGKGSVKFSLDSANNVVADDGLPYPSEYTDLDPTGSSTGPPTTTPAPLDEESDANMEESNNESTNDSDNESKKSEEDSDNGDAEPRDDWVDISTGEPYRIKIDRKGARYFINQHDEKMVWDADEMRWVVKKHGMHDFEDYRQVHINSQGQRYYVDDHVLFYEEKGIDRVHWVQRSNDEEN